MQAIAIKPIDQSGALIAMMESTETPKDLPTTSNTPAETASVITHQIRLATRLSRIAAQWSLGEFMCANLSDVTKEQALRAMRNRRTLRLFEVARVLVR